jgi:hypothetical protein
MTTVISTKTKLAMSVALATALLSAPVVAKDVNDAVIDMSRAALERNTDGKGFGPQTPRDLDSKVGTNMRKFSMGVPSTDKNLCNIHFHRNAEHKGGNFTTYAGNGDGMGNNTGYMYDGTLSKAEKKPLNKNVCAGKGTSLLAGDTLEVHFVYTSAQATPGPTLGACLSESVMNPGLRVEGQVIVLVNDEDAIDFTKMAEVGMANGYHQAVNIPTDTGTPIEYLGSTTGPAYNEVASPLKVVWSVRPEVAKVNLASVGTWCDSNVFNEDHAHAVRNLVTNPKLLSQMD